MHPTHNRVRAFFSIFNFSIFFFDLTPGPLKTLFFYLLLQTCYNNICDETIVK